MSILLALSLGTSVVTLSCGMYCIYRYWEQQEQSDSDLINSIMEIEPTNTIEVTVGV